MNLSIYLSTYLPCELWCRLASCRISRAELKVCCGPGPCITPACPPTPGPSRTESKQHNSELQRIYDLIKILITLSYKFEVMYILAFNSINTFQGSKFM